MSIYSRSPSPEAAAHHRNNNNISDDEDHDRRSDHSSVGNHDNHNNEDDEPPRSRQRTSDPENSEDEEDAKKKKKSNKPRGPVRRQMISEDMLTGVNGLSKLDESFKDFKFGGKGREKEDLDRMLNKIEQWVHTLHPKYPFDQCLERIEYLGNKKKVIKTYVKKMRMGLLPTTTTSETVDQVLEDDDDDDLFPQFDNEGEIIIPESTINNNNNQQQSDDIAEEFPDSDDELMEVQPDAINTTTSQPQRGPSPADHGDIPTFEEQMQLEEEEDF